MNGTAQALNSGIPAASCFTLETVTVPEQTPTSEDLPRSRPARAPQIDDPLLAEITRLLVAAYRPETCSGPAREMTADRTATTTCSWWSPTPPRRNGGGAVWPTRFSGKRVEPATLW